MTRKINPTLSYYGAKVMMNKKILSYFPNSSEYDCFVDVFGGSGSIILNAPYAPVRVCNDLEQNVYNFHKVLQNPELKAQFEKKCFYSLSISRKNTPSITASLGGLGGDEFRVVRFGATTGHPMHLDFEYTAF